jgi:hypothetical protein
LIVLLSYLEEEQRGEAGTKEEIYHMHKCEVVLKEAGRWWWWGGERARQDDRDV